MKILFLNIFIITFCFNLKIIAGEQNVIAKGKKTEIQKTAHLLSSFFIIFNRGPIYRFTGNYSTKQNNYFKLNKITESELFIDYSRYEMKPNFMNHMWPNVIAQFKKYYQELPMQHARVMDYYVKIFKVRAKANFIVTTDEQSQFLLLWNTKSPYHFLNQNGRYLQRIKKKPLFLNSINQLTRETLFTKKMIKASSHLLPSVKFEANTKKEKSLIFHLFLNTFNRAAQYNYAGKYTQQEIDFLSDNNITENQLFIKYSNYYDALLLLQSTDTLSQDLYSIFQQNIYLEYAKVFNEFCAIFLSFIVNRDRPLSSYQLQYLKMWDKESVNFFLEKLQRLLKNESFRSKLTFDTKNILIEHSLMFYTEKEYAIMMNEFIALYARLPVDDNITKKKYSTLELHFYQKWFTSPPSEKEIYEIILKYKSHPLFKRDLNELSLKILYPANGKYDVVKLQEYLTQLKASHHPYIIEQAFNLHKDVSLPKVLNIIYSFIIILEEEINDKIDETNWGRIDSQEYEINYLKYIHSIAVKTKKMLEGNIDEKFRNNNDQKCIFALEKFYQLDKKIWDTL